MDINMVDVTVHIHETLDEARSHELVAKLRQQEGVIAIGFHDDKPHLMIIEYNPDQIKSATLLETIKSEGIHASLIGL